MSGAESTQQPLDHPIVSETVRHSRPIPVARRSGVRIPYVGEGKIFTTERHGGTEALELQPGNRRVSESM